jgi:hypothetical protein
METVSNYPLHFKTVASERTVEGSFQLIYVLVALKKDHLQRTRRRLVSTCPLSLSLSLAHSRLLCEGGLRHFQFPACRLRRHPDLSKQRPLWARDEKCPKYYEAFLAAGGEGRRGFQAVPPRTRHACALQGPPFR